MQKFFPLRPFQKEALDALREPGHVILVSPTGSGKSLVFTRYLQENSCRALLISPLVALGYQHRSTLTNAGLSSKIGVGAHGTGRPYGTQTWIVSPEKIFDPDKSPTLEFLRQWKPELLIVDECHSIWDWGESFRPAFRDIPRLIPHCSIPRTLWMTATLPNEARKQLKKNLPGCVTEIGRFSIPEALRIHVRPTPWPERLSWLIRWVREQKEPGLVYTLTRDSTGIIQRALAGQGIPSLAYHGGMSSEERRIAERWASQGIPHAIVATTSFGMGMDLKHLAWIVIHQLPPGLIALAQIIGRVARFGREGLAWVLWDQRDFNPLEAMLAGSSRSQKSLLDLWSFLKSNECRSQCLERLIENGLSNERPCGRCDQCMVQGLMGPKILAMNPNAVPI